MARGDDRRSGTQVAGRLGRRSAGRARPHPYVLLASAQGQRVWTPREGTGWTLRPGQGLGDVGCLWPRGALWDRTTSEPRRSALHQPASWGPRSAALSFESLWKSLKFLLVTEGEGLTGNPPPSPPTDRGRGSEQRDWGCLPAGTLAERVPPAASICLPVEWDALWHPKRVTAPSTWQVEVFTELACAI